jgi:glycosyltransferase involved in cell wall biosynthesis
MAVIVHLTSAHPRTDVRIFLKECRSLAQRGHAVTLLVADGLGAEVRDGVQIESVPRTKGRLGRMGLAPIRLLWKALHLRADLYHLHDPELIPMGVFLKAWGAKVVFDAHEDLPKQVLNKSYLPLPVRRIVSTVTSAFLRITFPWFDGLVAATPTIRNILLRINTNTIDINNYPILGELVTGDRSISLNRFVCYVGAISRIRGVFELVSALELLPKDIRLQLAGPFEDSAVETSLKGMEGWHQVDYLGVIGRDGVRQAMAASMVGIVTLLPAPNYLDSQPIKMFEYMSAGLAVVASDFPLWQSILGEGPCGLCVNPQDPKAIADAILSLVSQPEVALAMGRHGQKAVRERFNWEVESNKLGSYYDSILSPKGRAAGMT